MEALATLSEISLWLFGLCCIVILIDFVVRPLIGWGPLNVAVYILEGMDSRKRKEREKPDAWRVESGRVFPNSPNKKSRP